MHAGGRTASPPMQRQVSPMIVSPRSDVTALAGAVRWQSTASLSTSMHGSSPVIKEHVPPSPVLTTRQLLPTASATGIASPASLSSVPHPAIGVPTARVVSEYPAAPTATVVSDVRTGTRSGEPAVVDVPRQNGIQVAPEKKQELEVDASWMLKQDRLREEQQEKLARWHQETDPDTRGMRERIEAVAEAAARLSMAVSATDTAQAQPEQADQAGSGHANHEVLQQEVLEMRAQLKAARSRADMLEAQVVTLARAYAAGAEELQAAQPNGSASPPALDSGAPPSQVLPQPALVEPTREPAEPAEAARSEEAAAEPVIIPLTREALLQHSASYATDAPEGGSSFPPSPEMKLLRAKMESAHAELRARTEEARKRQAVLQALDAEAEERARVAAEARAKLDALEASNQVLMAEQDPIHEDAQEASNHMSTASDQVHGLPPASRESAPACMPPVVEEPITSNGQLPSPAEHTESTEQAKQAPAVAEQAVANGPKPQSQIADAGGRPSALTQPSAAPPAKPAVKAPSLTSGSWAERMRAVAGMSKSRKRGLRIQTTSTVEDGQPAAQN
eukprot:gnl/TRDRNA2_/TRDRNA2_135581_c0_seq1.p1 gnl/TRDRNA2_/TRDRNA2_135581_c0~~gnl/TRDRNA2_/TRDRNA2_135581_c0_seq1.p1  ORF type:complete len:601 (-),score=83.05 gnl/TRDRNA2_/TRDRNA2_135581_c0_seq1:120-1811(-)